MCWSWTIDQVQFAWRYVQGLFLNLFAYLVVLSVLALFLPPTRFYQPLAWGRGGTGDRIWVEED